MDWIVPNTVIEWQEKDSDNEYIERILWVDAKGERLVTITLEDDKAFPVTNYVVEYLKSVSDRDYRIIDWIDTSIILDGDDNIPQIYLEKRDKAWELIRLLVESEPDIYDPKLRGVMVNEIIENTGVHKSTIYRYLRRYWQSGKTKNSLLPHYKNSGGRGNDRKSNNVKRGRPRKYNEDIEGINITDEVRQLFKAGIRMFYNTKEKRPLNMAYQKTIEKFFNRGYKFVNGVKVPILPPEDELPTFGQFRYWFNKDLNLEESIKKRYGKRNYELKYRPILGDSTTKAFGPGTRFQIDATLADVYLVNQFNREWIIGRPVIYVVIDVFSRLITGLYVGLEGPSWIGAMMTLANTTIDKVKYCKEFGIEIEPDEWISSHLPQKLTADRGEFEGTKPNYLINTLGVDVEIEPPYRADWKSIVEQQFRLLNLRTIKWIPGAVEDRKRERGDRDYRLDATLTLTEFTQIIIHTVLYHNNQHYMEWYNRNEFLISDNIPPNPRELWNWGIKNRNGRLKRVPEDIVKLNLMYHGTAKVTKSGIIFKEMAYSSEIALREQWFTKARTNGSWPVKVAYDPRTTNEIYLWIDNGKKYETCYLFEREERYLNKTFEEVEDLHAIEKQESKKGEQNNLRSKVELDAVINSIVKQAEQKTSKVIENSEISKTQRTKRIRENRNNEKEINRTNEAFNLNETKTKKQDGKVISINKQKLVETYIPPAEKSSKLKSILENIEDDENE